MLPKMGGKQIGRKITRIFDRDTAVEIVVSVNYDSASSVNCFFQQIIGIVEKLRNFAARVRDFRAIVVRVVFVSDNAAERVCDAQQIAVFVINKARRFLSCVGCRNSPTD